MAEVETINEINKLVQERITEKDKMDKENKKFTVGSEIARRSHNQQPRSDNEHQNKMTAISQEFRKLKISKNSEISDNKNKHDDSRERSEEGKNTENLPKWQRYDLSSHTEANIKKPYIDAASTNATASAATSTEVAGARASSEVES